MRIRKIQLKNGYKSTLPMMIKIIPAYSPKDNFSPTIKKAHMGIKILIAWFKKNCHLKTKNFNPYIHAYPDNDIGKTIDYWSNREIFCTRSLIVFF